jgi:hypothetical protein
MMRKLLKTIDNKALKGLIAKRLLMRRRHLTRSKLTKHNFESIEIFYSKNYKNSLSQLFDKYGSDKGSNFHSGHVYDWTPNSYADLYSFLFDSLRSNIKVVFECGIGTNNPKLPSSMGAKGKPGASLRAWREFFPNAQVYGADVDEAILFNEERITTGFMNQLDPTSIKTFFDSFQLRDVDVIIDDGLHTFSAALSLFENAFPYLAKSGIYFIEDIHPYEMQKFLEYFKDSKLDVNYSIFTNQDRLPVGNLIWIQKQEVSNRQN